MRQYYNDRVEGWFALRPDVIVLGVGSDQSLFNPETPRRIETLREAVLRIPGVIAPDVISLPTGDDVTSVGGTLEAQPLLAEIPATPEQMAVLEQRLLANPLPLVAEG